MYWELQLLSSVWLFATLFARGQVVETNSQKMNGWWPGEGWEEGIVREVGVDMCTCSVQFSCSVVSDSLQPHGLQHARLPVHHQLSELAQTHVHPVGDAIQPSRPLSSPSPPAFKFLQHQGLFPWVSSSLGPGVSDFKAWALLIV